MHVQMSSANQFEDALQCFDTMLPFLSRFDLVRLHRTSSCLSNLAQKAGVAERGKLFLVYRWHCLNRVLVKYIIRQLECTTIACISPGTSTSRLFLERFVPNAYKRLMYARYRFNGIRMRMQWRKLHAWLCMDLFLSEKQRKRRLAESSNAFNLFFGQAVACVSL